MAIDKNYKKVRKNERIILKEIDFSLDIEKLNLAFPDIKYMRDMIAHFCENTFNQSAFRENAIKRRDDENERNYYQLKHSVKNDKLVINRFGKEIIYKLNSDNLNNLKEIKNGIYDRFYEWNKHFPYD